MKNVFSLREALITTLLFIVVVFAGQTPSPLFGQALDDYLDETSAGKEGNPPEPTTAPPVVSEQEKSGLANFVSWLQEHHLTPNSSVLSNWWNKTNTQWELYKQTRALKAEIEQKFNISLREGGLWFHSGSSDYQATCWTLGELQAVKDTLEHCPESFRGFTRYINRAKAHVEDGADDDCSGIVWKKQPSVVFMFDPSADPGENYSFFKRTLVHEMTHSYQYQNDSILSDWNAEFWAEYSGPAVSLNFISTPDKLKLEGVKFAAMPAGAYPMGSPVSAYGAYDGKLGEHRGEEDQAEAVSFAWCSPGSLSAFPKRETFLKSRFPAELFDGAHAPEAGGSGSWGKKEDYHYTIVPLEGASRWYDIKAGSDSEGLRVFRLKTMAAALGFNELDDEDIK
jgi:hypothetical protein